MNILRLQTAIRYLKERTPDYSFEDVYNAHKYTRLTSLYSSMNKLIREDEENGREARRQLNAYLDAMQKEGMTKYDKALANIAEVTGVELRRHFTVSDHSSES